MVVLFKSAELINLDLFLRDGNKAWNTLFTCAVYRAVHLELVKFFSTLTKNLFPDVVDHRSCLPIMGPIFKERTML